MRQSFFWILPVLILFTTSCNEITNSPDTSNLSNSGSSEETKNTIPNSPASPSSSTTPSNSLTGTATLDEEEWSFLTLINDYRAQNGAPKLQVSISLTRASDWLSTDMASKNYFSHTDSTGRNAFSRICLLYTSDAADD